MNAAILYKIHYVELGCPDHERIFLIADLALIQNLELAPLEGLQGLFLVIHNVIHNDHQLVAEILQVKCTF